MSKKFYLLLTLTLALVASAFALWCVNKKAVAPLVAEPIQTLSQKNKTDSIGNEPRFVTDVDPDVKNWQTKETEFFTIKFPKEWYWLESDFKKANDYSVVITNNPEFPIDKYADIHFFPGNDVSFSSEDLSNTGIVIAFRINPTSNAGTSRESIDWEIERLKKYSSSDADCKFESNFGNNLVAYCSFIGEQSQSKSVQTYFIANNSITTVMTGWTRDNSILDRNVLKAIAKNFIIH